MEQAPTSTVNKTKLGKDRLARNKAGKDRLAKDKDI